MPSLFKRLQGGFGGAGTGFALGGPWGAAAGGLLGLFAGGGPDEEEQRVQRYRDYIQHLVEMKTKELEEGTGIIGRQTNAEIAQAGEGATRRTMAMGRADQAEAFKLPFQAKAAQAGSESLERFTTGVNRQFDTLQAQAEGEFADRAIAPDTADLLELIGSKAMGFSQNKSLLDILSKTDMAPGEDKGSRFTPRSNYRSTGYDPLNIIQPKESRDRNYSDTGFDALNIIQPEGSSGEGSGPLFGRKKRRGIFGTGYEDPFRGFGSVPRYSESGDQFSSGLLSGVY